MTKSNTPILSIGIDLGKRTSRYCVLDKKLAVVKEDSVDNTPKDLERTFRKYPPVRVAIEACGISPWVSRLISNLGHKAIVANPRNVALISKSQKKSDRHDAELLARLAASDPKLLSPITHRGEQAQRDLAKIRLRDTLVRGRVVLTASLRGIFESLGSTLPGCSTECFHKRMRAVLSKDDLAVAEPMLAAIEAITLSIHKCDREIKRAATHDYPETKILQTAPGVGPVVSLAFVLTLDDSSRFKKSRVVGAFIGLTPRKHQSGDSDPELGITKAGNKYLRRLLVLSAHRILGRFGTECDLRDWGLKLAQRGGKNAKKRAVVAVARKLATILHRMWVTRTDFIARRSEPRPIIKHILKSNKKERNAKSA